MITQNTCFIMRLQKSQNNYIINNAHSTPQLFPYTSLPQSIPTTTHSHNVNSSETCTKGCLSPTTPRSNLLSPSRTTHADRVTYIRHSPQDASTSRVQTVEEYHRPTHIMETCQRHNIHVYYRMLLLFMYLFNHFQQEFTSPILSVYHTRFIDGVRTTDLDNAYLLPRLMYAHKLKVYGGSVSALRISDIQLLNRLTHLHEVIVSIIQHIQ
jgi:hypothetical protein